MKKEDFDNLVTSIRQAGRIRRGQMKPARVTTASGPVGLAGGTPMIGRKNLSEIRKELQQATAIAGGDDPIAWLEERISAAERERPEKTEVLRSLKRILETRPGKRRKQRVRTKK